MNYRSITYCTSNEERLREVIFDYERTWWEVLLRRPGKTEVWVGGTIWYNKHTGQRASGAKAAEIDQAVRWSQIETRRLEKDIG